MKPGAETGKYLEENLVLKNQIEERTGKTVDQLFEEKAKRVRDVIELRQPDQVPFMVLVEPHRYSGIPKSAAFRKTPPLWTVYSWGWKVSRRSMSVRSFRKWPNTLLNPEGLLRSSARMSETRIEEMQTMLKSIKE